MSIFDTVGNIAEKVLSGDSTSGDGDLSSQIWGNLSKELSDNLNSRIAFSGSGASLRKFLDFGNSTDLFGGAAADHAISINSAELKSSVEDLFSTKDDSKSLFSFVTDTIDEVKDTVGGLKDIVSGDVGGGLKRFAGGLGGALGFDNIMGQYGSQLKQAGLTDWCDEAGRELGRAYLGGEHGAEIGNLLGGLFGTASEASPNISEQWRAS
jgi:hypothetical protein